ncbi:MAG: N-acetyltransferase [Paracoccaceae bacterium]|jgi:hypothetical protein|nr:N-acetyltransferase [Paracoccaceae bacterium]MDP7185465.1 N-acetyltransferase [Paracoccaceae bacterium]
MTEGLEIDAMDVGDLREVLGWAADEGWNPGVADAEAFHASDPSGFFLARIDGKAVAAISVVNHDAGHAFLGLYICRPDWRGLGIGLKTWAHGLAHAGQRSVGLDGVPDQEANYRKSGFVRVGQSLRYVGRWEPAQSAAVRALRAEDAPVLMAMDARAGGFARPQFLSGWLAPVPGLRETRVLERGGAVTGFATWRACGEGTKIGPVIAPDTASALELIADIAALRPEGPLIVDLPEANTVLRLELEAAGFDVPFTTARMYRGTVPEFGATLQAIATMELG